MTINRMLVVEDDAPVMCLLEKQFARHLCPEVDAVMGADAAIGMLAGEHYDLVVSDGLEGDCFRLRDHVADFPDTEFVIYSSNPDVQDRAAGEGTPCYIKPDGWKDIVRHYGQ
ncbi:MAG: hypothetical protein ABH879_04495 [archaeon]